MKRDSQIFDLIAAERSRQTHGIELIASENFVSQQVMEAMGSVLTNKYAEGYPAARYYGGCEVVDKVESLAIERVCRLYGAEYANVQPHSGAQANMAVFFACLQPGDTFMGLDLAHGGHLSHGSPVNMSGKYFKAVGYQLDEATGRIKINFRTTSSELMMELTKFFKLWMRLESVYLIPCFGCAPEYAVEPGRFRRTFRMYGDGPFTDEELSDAIAAYVAAFDEILKKYLAGEYASAEEIENEYLRYLNSGVRLI